MTQGQATQQERRSAWRLLPLLACALLASQVGAQSRVITNASFENNVNGTLMSVPAGWRIVDDARCGVGAPADCMGGWYSTHPANGSFVHGVEVGQTTGTPYGINADSGTRMVELNADAPSRLYQNVCLVNNEPITITYRHGIRNSGQVQQVRAGIWPVNNTGPTGGALVSQVSTASSSTGWISNSALLTANQPTGVYQIGFEAVQPASGSVGNLLDTVSITLNPLVDMAGSPTMTTVQDSLSVPAPSTPAPPLKIRINGTVPAGGFTLAIRANGTATPDTHFNLGTPTGPYGTPSITHTPGTNLWLVFVPAGGYDGGTNPASNSGGISIPFTATGIPASGVNVTFTVQDPGVDGSSGSSVWSLTDPVCTGVAAVTQSTYNLVQGPTIRFAGSVYNDRNDSGTRNGTPLENWTSTIPLASTVYVNAVNASNAVVASQSVLPGAGDFSLDVLAGPAYRLVLTDSTGNATAQAPSLWTFRTPSTGQYTGLTDPALNQHFGLLSRPVLSKSFGAASIALTATTTLTFQITNTDSQPARSGLAFQDRLPLGLSIVTPVTASQCGGTVSSTVVGGQHQVNFTGGTLAAGAAGASCTIAVTVRGSSSGSKVNGPGNIVSITNLANDVDASIDVIAGLSGRILEDVLGHANSGSLVAIPAATAAVCLLRDNGNNVPGSTDTLIACSDTLVDGSYGFGQQTAGTYWVAVRSSLVTPTAGGSGVAEQTWGPAGAWCVGSGGSAASPSYSDDSQRTGAGPCYGGRRSATADTFAGTAASLANAEHIARVSLSGSGEVSGVDFGFSFNVVTNLAASAQGSLNQFIANANGVTGANTMRFVPTLPTNASGAGQAWWRLGLTGALTTLTGADTTVDGQAWWNADGTTALSTHGGLLGDNVTAGRSTGEGAGLGSSYFNLSPLTGRSLELNGGGNQINLLALNAANAVVRNLALTRARAASSTGPANAAISISAGATNALIQANAFGVATWADPAGQRGVTAIRQSGAASGLVIEGNVMGWLDGPAVYLAADAPNLVVRGNQIRDTGLNTTTAGALDRNGTRDLTNALIERNHIQRSSAHALDLDTTTGLHTLRHNTILSSGQGGTAADSAIYINRNSSTAILIEDNHLASNAGSAIALANNNLRNVEVRRNSFGGNGGNAIDLGDDSVDGNTSACVNTNGAGSPNAGLARPTLSRAVLVGNTLLLSGDYCATGTFALEVYKAEGVCAGDCLSGAAAGEGTVYLGALTGLSGGTFTNLSLNVAGLGLSPGDSLSLAATRTSSNVSTSEFAANLATFAVAGHVFQDAPANNGVWDAGEDWDGNTAPLSSLPTVYLKLASRSGGSCTTPALASLAFGSPNSGVYSLGLSPADYCLLVDDNSNLADTSPSTPTDWSFSPLASGQRTITVAGSALTGQDFGLNRLLRALLGRIFRDIGAAPAANNGLIDGGEAGIPGVQVTASDCASTTLATATTDGNGDYQMSLPVLSAGAALCVLDGSAAQALVSTGASVNATALPSGTATNVGGTSYTYNRAANPDRISFAYNGGSHTGLNFGNVPVNSFALDSSKSAMPGGLAYHPYTFVAGTGGQLSFSLSAVNQTPPGAPWTQVVYRDLNCNQALDGGEALLTAPLTVAAGETVCLLLRQDVPAGVGMGAQSVLNVQAQFSYSNANPALPLDMRTQTATTVVGDTTLQLTKEVRNVTQGGGFGVSNQARTGDVLEYRVSFQNMGAAAINNLVIADVTPPYTSFASADAGPLPAGLSACSKTTPAGGPVACTTAQATGGNGPLQWQFTGSLPGGGNGHVLFRIQVN